MKKICGFFSLYFTLSSSDIYYYLKDGQRYETLDLHEAVKAGVQRLVIDFNRTFYLYQINPKNDGSPNITIRYVGSSRLDQCTYEYKRGSTPCSSLARTLIIEGDIFLDDDSFHGYETGLEEYLGCYQTSKNADLETTKVEDFIGCKTICDTLFFGINTDTQCICIDDMINLTPRRLDQCQSVCFRPAYVFCGREHNIDYFSVYAKEAVVQDRQTPSWECLYSDTNCPTCPIGRIGLSCEILDCPNDNGKCGKLKECDSFLNTEAINVSVCVCKEGGFLNQSFECLDINECPDEPCQDNSFCDNTAGSYVCLCHEGFSVSGHNLCDDIDECVMNPCGENSFCNNTRGSYDCLCKPGFDNEEGVCKDIDECLGNPCVEHSLCKNILGSYKCTCKRGFYMKGGECKDINECIVVTCAENSFCNNTLGSYECVCEIGFYKTGFFCTDIDECLNDPCTAHSLCTNTAGSYTCKCKIGFLETDEDTCSDIDECLENPCEENRLCQNTLGSYNCVCKNGFYEKRGVCEDIDECAFGVACPPKVKCTNVIGSFHCQCSPGMELKNYIYWTECEDMNECLMDSCDRQSSYCLNTLGSYFCVCIVGYVAVDNFTCILEKKDQVTEKSGVFQGPLYYYAVTIILSTVFAVGMTIFYLLFNNPKKASTPSSESQK